ncbi:MAG: acyltransferase family protein [Flavobacteriaceae bacterium]|nr:acyltransferase family protein [Flavobacteriaceae bacterium]
MDWIRVIAFDLLILFHIGMFFVSWDWHIKNNETIEWMRWPMIFVNQWRIPILFVVSGMGTRFALSQRSGKQYLKERSFRLLIPLLVGVLIIVAPQVYIERLTEGATYNSFIEFYPDFFKGLYPKGNFSWHHLWFLPYLFLMSLIATPLFLNLRKNENKILNAIINYVKKQPFSLFLFAIPLFITEFFLSAHFPITHDLIGDWYALVFYFILFISGFILVSLGKSLWVALDKIKYHALFTGIIAFPLLLWMWYNLWRGYYIESVFIPIVKVINVWSWILVLFAFSAKFLNNESRIIKYRNQAVYPFYVLHQTITIILGYWLMNHPMHYMWKFTIMVMGTFGITWFIYEFFIRRIIILRPLFGLKTR